MGSKHLFQIYSHDCHVISNLGKVTGLGDYVRHGDFSSVSDCPNTLDRELLVRRLHLDIERKSLSRSEPNCLTASDALMPLLKPI